jgi:hypothetical protein
MSTARQGDIINGGSHHPDPLLMRTVEHGKVVIALKRRFVQLRSLAAVPEQPDARLVRLTERRMPKG